MRGSLLRSAVLFGSLALGGALVAPDASAVSWNDYRLGDFYDISQATDPAVRAAGHAVVFFGNATGFLISPEGHVLTNYHVYQSFGNSGTVYVEWTSQGYVRTLHLQLVVARADYDMALYKAQVTGAPYLKIDTSAPYAGEDVFIVGHPNSRSQEVSYGKVLATGHTISGRPSIEYSAQTWWGSSGSPICNRAGNVIALHWGWDEYGTSTGRLAGIPFNLMARGVSQIGQIAAAYGVGASPSAPSSASSAVASSTSSSSAASSSSASSSRSSYPGLPSGGGSALGRRNGSSTASASSSSSTSGSGYRTLPVNGSVAGNLGSTGAVNYFRCDVQTRGDLTVDLRGPAGADFDLVVWKWDFGSNRGTNVGTANGGTANERVVVQNATPGTYVVVVNSYAGSGAYTLSAALSQQNNVGGGAASSATGVLTGGNDWKLYQLDTQGGTIEVTLDGPAGTDFDLYVFRGLQADANQLVAKGESMASHEDVTFAAAAGRYSVLVRSANGGGQFTLTVR
jgi:hypothetical protein